jgi:uncharacterized membrane protein
MALELLWRGWSHGSMFLAGGLCFVLLGHLNAVRPRLSMPMRVITGTAGITMVELGMGLLVNRNYTVWDYRDQPGNFLGQICPGFMLLWLPLAWLALVLYDILDRQLERERMPGRKTHDFR